MTEEKAMVPTVQSGEVAVIESRADLQARMDHSALEAESLRVLAISRTQPTDWIMMGANPYLQDKGIQRVAQPWGIDFGRIEFEEPEKIDEEVLYTCHGSATSHRNASTEHDIGTASTADSFVAKDWVQAVKQGNTPKKIECLSKVKKKAVTNLHGRLVRKLTGLNGCTREEVEAVLGAKIGSVEFKKGARGGTSEGVKGGGEATADNSMTKQQFGYLMGQYADGLVEAPSEDEYRSVLSAAKITRKRASDIIGNLTEKYSKEEPLSWEGWQAVLSKK